MQDSYNLYMPCYPEEIKMGGHPLRLMKKPAKTPYCCKGCKERDVRPCYKREDKHCHYHLHKECYDSFSCEKSSIIFNLSSTKSNCDFIFHKEALGGKGVCDACGDDVKGWFYKCKMCKKPHYLHPCCAKLPIKKYADTQEGEIIIDLKAKSPSKCLICENKENSDGFSGWYYISRCGKYCYHWSCMKHMALEMWKEDDDQCSCKGILKSTFVALLKSTLVALGLLGTEFGGQQLLKMKGGPLAIKGPSPLICKLPLKALISLPLTCILLSLVKEICSRFGDVGRIGRTPLSNSGVLTIHSSEKQRPNTTMSSQALKTTTQKIDTVQLPNRGNQKRGYETGKNRKDLPARAQNPDKKPRLESGNQKQGYETGKKRKDLPARAQNPDKNPRLESGNQKQGCETGTKSQAMQPSQDTQHSRDKAIGYTAEVAVELLNIFIPRIFGLPPLPSGLVLKLLKLWMLYKKN